MTVLTDTQKLLLEAQQACERGDTHRMLVAADELLRREPDNVDAMFISGTAFLKAEQYGMAVLTLNAARCATKDPIKLGAIWNNLGCALQEYQPEESYRAFRKSLEYGAPPHTTYDNLCNVSSQIGRHAEALEWAEKSETIDPAYNKSFALMHMGRWAEAWAEYAKSAGTATRPLTGRDYDLPRWDGKRAGKVVIHGEQGVGDEIMFMSMCPRDFDGVIECNARNEGLFARSFPKARVYGTLLRQYIEWPLIERPDYHLEMGGLGEYFAPEPFRRGGFLSADSARRAAWRIWLSESVDGIAANDAGQSALRLVERRTDSGGAGALHADHLEGRGSAALGRGRLRVGISWTGGSWSTGRLRRSIPFDLIGKLIDQHPDVTWVCLEYEDRRDHLTNHPHVLNPHWATKKGADMDETAALAASLDLVISATQSLVDVCGGLGVPCWAMVDSKPPWRYAEKAGENQMWFYESVRTFRQKERDDGKWDRVVAGVSAALHAHKLQAKAA